MQRTRQIPNQYTYVCQLLDLFSHLDESLNLFFVKTPWVIINQKNPDKQVFLNCMKRDLSSVE